MKEEINKLQNKNWNVNISTENTLSIPKYSNYKCYLFGNRPDVNCGITYTPVEGRVPNRFVRWMMWICFDSVWVKEK
jgi:hypothetical protein